MGTRFYVACITALAPDGTSGVFFPDFPGCITLGGTVQEAAEHAVDALAVHVAGMVEDGELLPAPSAPDAPLPDWATEEGAPDLVARILVPVEPPGKAVRVQITMDEGLLRRADAAAEADGYTRSGFLAQAVRERLTARHGPQVAAAPAAPRTTSPPAATRGKRALQV